MKNISKKQKMPLSSSDPVKILNEAPRVNLLISIEVNTAHRNAAVIFALVSAVLIYWQDWKQWLFLLPCVLVLYAVLRQANLILIKNELKQRTSGKKSANDPIANNEIKEDKLVSFEWLKNKHDQIEQKMTMPLSEEELFSLSEELSSLRDAMSRLASEKIDEIVDRKE